MVHSDNSIEVWFHYWSQSCAYCRRRYSDQHCLLLMYLSLCNEKLLLSLWMFSWCWSGICKASASFVVERIELGVRGNIVANYIYILWSAPVPQLVYDQGVYSCLYLSICLYVSISVCLFVCLSLCLSVCPSLFESISLFLRLTVCLSLSLSVCLSVCLPLCLSVFHLSVCLSVFIFLSLSVCIIIIIEIHLQLHNKSFSFVSFSFKLPQRGVVYIQSLNT